MVFLKINFLFVIIVNCFILGTADYPSAPRRHAKKLKLALEKRDYTLCPSSGFVPDYVYSRCQNRIFFELGNTKSCSDKNLKDSERDNCLGIVATKLKNKNLCEKAKNKNICLSRFNTPNLLDDTETKIMGLHCFGDFNNDGEDDLLFLKPNISKNAGFDVIAEVSTEEKKSANIVLLTQKSIKKMTCDQPIKSLNNSSKNDPRSFPILEIIESNGKKSFFEWKNGTLKPRT